MRSREKKILLAVLASHLTLLVVIILISSPSRKDFYSSPITSVDLVEPMEVAPVMEEEAPAPEPEAAPEPEPEPEIEARPKPKKIVKKVSPLRLPPSDLKKRLRERISQVKTATPKQAARSPGVSSADAQRFPFSWYNNFIQSKMHNLWRRPPKSAVKKESATTLISFRVYRDGHIENIRLKESSGSAVMDESALRAARMADPLPPLPHGFKGGYEDFIILFELTD